MPQKVIGVRILSGRCYRDDPLMICVVSEPIERNARLAANGDTSLAGGFEDFAEPGVAHAFGDDDAIDSTPAGFQRFKHRQHSVDVGHKVTL